MEVKAAIITGYGINADNELVLAFQKSGAVAEKVHINDLIQDPAQLHSFHIAGFAGGFSFGDHLGSGLVYAQLFKQNLQTALDRFIADGKLIIGICNGFQVLVKMGVLPNLKGDWTQEVSLIHNQSGVFQDQWVRLAFNPQSPCVWTRGLDEMEAPIRHGEGRFITDNAEIMQTLTDEHLLAVRYVGDNPNGSEDNVAGITDRTGRILGLMPHPEAFIIPQNHPQWTRKPIAEGFGLRIFKNGVRYIQENFNGSASR